MHKLTDKNPDERTATCSLCGPTKIYKSGSRFVCAVAQDRRMADWKLKNPAAAKANRAVKSVHKLVKSGCAICGEVMPVPYGRGYACPNTPAVLRRGIQQESPALRCKICASWDRADAPLNELRECPSCEAERVMQETGTYVDFLPHSGDDLPGEYDGYHVLDPETDNPYWDEPENVVPGWRVIGDAELIVHE